MVVIRERGEETVNYIVPVRMIRECEFAVGNDLSQNIFRRGEY